MTEPRTARPDVTELNVTDRDMTDPDPAEAAPAEPRAAELRLLEPAAAAAALRETGAAARGFLGLDPVVQNDVLLARELGRGDAQVFRGGAGLLGFAPNRAQPHQAYVASTSADPEPLRAFLAFLDSYRRITSYVAEVPEGAPGARALEGCRFRRVGTLRAHRFASGAYRDVHVYYSDGEGPCPS